MNLVSQPLSGIFSEKFLGSDFDVGSEVWRGDSTSPESLSQQVRSSWSARAQVFFEATWNEEFEFWEDVIWPEYWELVKKADNSVLIPAGEGFFLRWDGRFEESGNQDVGYNDDFANILAYGVESPVDVSSLNFSTKPSMNILLADIDFRIDYEAGEYNTNMKGDQRISAPNDLYAFFISTSLSAELYEEVEEFYLSTAFSITPTRNSKIGNALYERTT